MWGAPHDWGPLALGAAAAGGGWWGPGGGQGRWPRQVLGGPGPAAVGGRQPGGKAPPGPPDGNRSPPGMEGTRSRGLQAARDGERHDCDWQQHGRAGVMPRGAGSTLGCSGRSLLPWPQHPPGGCPVLSPSHSHWVLLWDQQRPCPCLPEPHRTLHPQKNWHPLLSTTLQPRALAAGSKPCLYPMHPLPVQAAACWVLGVCHAHQPCWPHTYRSQRWSSSSPACRGAGDPSARPAALPAPAGSAACLAPTGGMKGDVAV